MSLILLAISLVVIETFAMGADARRRTDKEITGRQQHGIRNDHVSRSSSASSSGSGSQSNRSSRSSFESSSIVASRMLHHPLIHCCHIEHGRVGWRYWSGDSSTVVVRLTLVLLLSLLLLLCLRFIVGIWHIQDHATTRESGNSGCR